MRPSSPRWASRLQIRLDEIGLVLHIGNGTEEQRYHVEFPAELEIDHVGVVKLHVAASRPGLRKKMLVQINPGTSVMLRKMLEMAARAARDVE